MGEKNKKGNLRPFYSLVLYYDLVCRVNISNTYRVQVITCKLGVKFEGDNTADMVVLAQSL